MKKKIEQLILMLFCAILPLQAGRTEPVKSISYKSFIGELKLNNARINSLSSSKNWQELCKEWKKLGKYSSDVSYTSKAGKFSKLLMDLEKEKLLSKEEKDILNYHIYSRISYLELQKGQVTCYRMSLSGMKIREKQGDLEARYKMLEKLFNEKKISEKTYLETKNKIKEDLKVIDENSYNELKYKNFLELIDIIIYLNK